MTIHNADSTLREQYLEYGFLDVVCREMWKRGIPVDVLHTRTDRNGYDLALEANGVLRHIQLKSSFAGAKTARQTINTRLAEKPGGCVVWIRFDPATLDPVEYLWFGGGPGEPLPPLGDKVARHSKGNADGVKAERAGLRVVSRSAFLPVGRACDLAERLFGEAGTEAGAAALAPV